MTYAEKSSSTVRRLGRTLWEALALAVGAAVLAGSLLSPRIAAADEDHSPATPSSGTALPVAPTNDEEQPGGHEASAAHHADQLPQAAATAAPSAQPIHTALPGDAAEPHGDGDAHDAATAAPSAQPIHTALPGDAAEPHGDGDAHDAAGAEGEEPHGDANAHDAVGAEGEEAHGDAKAPAISTQTKQTVLGAFAGVNGLAIVTAAVLRRRSPPKLPKYLQR